MLQRFCSWLLYKRMGWTKRVTVDHPDKYIICLAPHTSNWDFIIGQLYMRAEGMHNHFLMKKEWFFWPLGPVFRRLGGIPVYRQKNSSLTDILAERAKESDVFRLAITPEGTRNLVATWKRGFYYIAQKAGIPIMLYAIDAQHRTIVCHRTLHPTGDTDNDMREIMEYYRPYIGRGFRPDLSQVEEIS